MKKSSVYQNEIYKKSLLLQGTSIIEIKDIFAVKKKITLPLLGEKRIIEARGNFNEEQLMEFKKTSKDFFYGTIMPCLLSDYEKIYKKVRYKKTKNHTILIDLKKEKEEIWKNLEKKSIRWGVKFAEKNSLSFSKAEKKDIDNFYEIYKKTTESGGFNAVKKEFILSLYDTEISKLFVVKRKSKILAGGMILIDNPNNYTILDLTASSEEGLKLQAMPFLYWNLINYSKNLGMNYFDLGGYDEEAGKNEKAHNINKFKERFGGKITEQPVYSTNVKYPFLRKLLRKARYLRKAYSKKNE